MNLINCVNSPSNEQISKNGNLIQTFNNPNQLQNTNNNDSIPEYLKTINMTPRDTNSSPSNYDESKCIVLSNQKCKPIDDCDDHMAIIDDSDNLYRTKDLQKKADYVTEEILSMMFFSDIHDNPIIPFRSKTMIEDARFKYPFNKPLGIDTTTEGVEKFYDELIEHVNSYYINDVIDTIQKPIVIEPDLKLEQLQIYDDGTNYTQTQQNEDVLSSDVFYTLEQVRKEMYETDDNSMITEHEKNSKIHNTFIHDKMLFDSFNSALHSLGRRKEEVYPWVYGKKSLTTKKYNNASLSNLFQKAKKEALKWSRMEVGTRKIPPAIQQQNSEDIFANPVPSDEERNQQLREEKLSLLLASEIKSPV